MLKKILSFFEGQKKEKRNRYRFDVQYRDEISLTIDKKSFKLKEISLEGFSFFLNEEASKEFKLKDKISIKIAFDDQEFETDVIIKNLSSKVCGCKVILNQAAFSKLIIDRLSPYLVSFAM